MAALQYAVGIYVAGVVLGLLMIDEPPVTRAGLAVLWPVGPAAFVMTVVILIAAATIAFPVFGVVLFGSLLVAGWALL